MAFPTCKWHLWLSYTVSPTHPEFPESIRVIVLADDALTAFSMSDDAPDSDFLRYLMCDLPLGYPLKSPISKLLVPNPTMAARRELLYQQDKFLDVANKFLPTHPWISYIAAIKHEAVLVIIPNYASQLVDIADVHFFTELQQKAKELQETSRAAIDSRRLNLCRIRPRSLRPVSKNFAILSSEAWPASLSAHSSRGTTAAWHGGWRGQSWWESSATVPSRKIRPSRRKKRRRSRPISITRITTHFAANRCRWCWRSPSRRAKRPWLTCLRA
jgi:hypothetical protein